ncbi:hypothetical protein HOY82DRAFT_607483 [Tuber indicum]|nr:hypothetical protein HOY82DRAFT_607483 [Tuber indicum]
MAEHSSAIATAVTGIVGPAMLIASEHYLSRGSIKSLHEKLETDMKTVRAEMESLRQFLLGDNQANKNQIIAAVDQKSQWMLDQMIEKQDQMNQILEKQNEVKHAIEKQEDSINQHVTRMQQKCFDELAVKQQQLFVEIDNGWGNIKATMKDLEVLTEVTKMRFDLDNLQREHSKMEKRIEELVFQMSHPGERNFQTKFYEFTEKFTSFTNSMDNVQVELLKLRDADDELAKRLDEFSFTQETERKMNEELKTLIKDKVASDKPFVKHEEPPRITANLTAEQLSPDTEVEESGFEIAKLVRPPKSHSPTLMSASDPLSDKLHQLENVLHIHRKELANLWSLMASLAHENPSLMKIIQNLKSSDRQGRDTKKGVAGDGTSRAH